MSINLKDIQPSLPSTWGPSWSDGGDRPGRRGFAKLRHAARSPPLDFRDAGASQDGSLLRALEVGGRAEVVKASDKRLWRTMT